MEVREVIVGSEWMTWWKAMQEEKKAGRKAVWIADWLQIRKDSSAKVLGLDSSHSVNKSTVKLVLSNLSENNIERFFQMINLRSSVIASHLTSGSVSRIISI